MANCWLLGADKIVGWHYGNGDDTLYIKELLADTDAVQDTLLYEAAHIYKVQRMDYFIPSSADTLFWGWQELSVQRSC